jgi:2'-hydroxyisoflavone reductase
MTGTTRRDFVTTTAKGAGALGLLGAAGVTGCAPAGDAPSGDATGDASPDPLRILILGGTSFIGPHQVKYALDRGHEVSTFTRGRTEPPFFQDYFARVEQLIGDRNDDLTALETGEWDVVIDNSASVPRWVRESAGLLAGRAERYLYVSSISAYAGFETTGMTEDAPVAQLEDPTVEEVTGLTYGGMKALSEQAARDAFGDNAIIVRPGLIIGPGDPTDRWTYWPVRIDRGGEVMAPNTPQDPVQNIDARDLSEWIVRLVEEPGHGGTYNGTSPVYPFGEMLETVRDAIGAEADFTWVSTEFMEEQQVAPWGHMTNWVPPQGEMAGMLQVSVDAAVQHGLTFRPVADTAQATLDWWNTLPEERRASPRAGLPAERETEVLAAWHAREA